MSGYSLLFWIRSVDLVVFPEQKIKEEAAKMEEERAKRMEERNKREEERLRQSLVEKMEKRLQRRSRSRSPLVGDRRRERGGGAEDRPRRRFTEDPTKSEERKIEKNEKENDGKKDVVDDEDDDDNVGGIEKVAKNYGGSSSAEASPRGENGDEADAVVGEFQGNAVALGVLQQAVRLVFRFRLLFFSWKKFMPCFSHYQSP